MDLPIQPLCNAIHVIPADEVTLTQWFLRPPTTPQDKKNPAAAQALPVPLAPPSKEKKKPNTRPLAPQTRPTASKMSKRSNWHHLVCHRSQRNMIPLRDLSHQIWSDFIHIKVTMPCLLLRKRSPSHAEQHRPPLYDYSCMVRADAVILFLFCWTQPRALHSTNLQQLKLLTAFSRGVFLFYAP